MRAEVGRFTDERSAWVTLTKFECIVFVGDNPAWQKEMDLPDTAYTAVRMLFRLPGRRQPFTISLTNMTVNELTELRKCIDFAFDQAAPICQDLDDKARQAWDEGDDSWSRMYRPDATFHLRRNNGATFNPNLPEQPGDGRDEPEHSEGIQERSDGSPVVGDAGLPDQERGDDGPAEDGGAVLDGTEERLDGGVGDTDPQP